jgi:hypothetical protein
MQSTGGNTHTGGQQYGTHMDIFGSVMPGTVKKISTSYGAVGGLALSTGLSLGDLIITSIGYSGSSAMQFMRTLSRTVYVYSFGLRSPSVSVSGMAFLRHCGGGQSALDDLLSLIGQFESAAASGTALNITIGSLSFTGFVDTLRTTWQDGDTGSIGFDLSFYALSAAGASAMTSW